MTVGVIAAIFGFNVLFSYILGFAVYRLLAKRNIFDKPNARSSHSEPTVRGGGIAIIVVALCSGVVIAAVRHDSGLWILVGAAVVLAVVSFLDDLQPLPPLIRFGCHALCAIAAVAALRGFITSVELSSGLFVRIPTVLAAILAFMWISGYTNAFNFMDGINGIAAGQAAVTAFGSGLLVGLATGDWLQTPVLFSFVLAGAAVGFLPHNFPRARMFMGDVGSAPLGFLLATLVIWISRRDGAWLLIPLALLHTNFVLDTGFTLSRRIMRRDRWYESHREHFYQRLTRAGKTHSFVTGWEFALQMVALALMLSYLYSSALIRISLIAVVLAMWTGFLLYCEVQFRRAQK